MDDNIAIWTITWTIKNRGRWSEEILFIFPENFTHPNLNEIENHNEVDKMANTVYSSE